MLLPWEIDKAWLNYLLGLVSLLIALGPWARHFSSGGFKLPFYIMQESDWVPCKFFFFPAANQEKKNPMKFVIFSPWIGSYSRLLSSGVLLNLQTMINLHTSLACIPWRHLATRKEVWSGCLKGHIIPCFRAENGGQSWFIFYSKLIYLRTRLLTLHWLFFQCVICPWLWFSGPDRLACPVLVNPSRGLFPFAFLIICLAVLIFQTWP